MDAPDDPRLRDVDYAWMAGDRLLAVPFRAGMTELTVPLPEGDWYDFHTGEKYTGEVTLRPAPEELPILVKGSAVVPLAEPVTHITDGMKFKLRLKCFGDAPRPARLFADDGFSFAYENEAPRWGEVRADGTLSPELATRYEVLP